MKRLLTVLIGLALVACPAFAAGVASAEGAALAAENAPAKAPPKPKPLEQQVRELKAYVHMLLGAISRLDKRMNGLEAKLAVLNRKPPRSDSAKKQSPTGGSVVVLRRGISGPKPGTLRDAELDEQQDRKAHRRAIESALHNIEDSLRHVGQPAPSP